MRIDLSLNTMTFRMVLVCVVCTLSVATGDHMPEDWIDPLDPLSHDPTKIERNYNKYLESRKQQQPDNVDDDTENLDQTNQIHVQSEASCHTEKREIEQLNKILQKRPVSQMPYFKQFVASFVKRVEEAHLVSYAESNYFEVAVSLTDADIQVLENFAQSTTENDRVRHTHAVLENMIISVKQADVPEGAFIDWRLWLHNVFLMVTAISSAVIAIHLQWRTGIPWKRVVGSTFVILFLISVPWNWWHLYQKEMATRMSKSNMAAPAECSPQDMDLFQFIWSGFSVQDKCENFYHSLHVDPWVEIPPTKAIAVTVTKFILEPLEHLGESLGKMVKATIKDLPAHLWPVALVFMLVVFTLLLVMGFGYRIRMFYLFGLEPNQPAIQPANQQMIEQIRDMRGQIQGLMEQTGTVHHMLEEHTRIIDEQIGQPQPLALPSVQPGEQLGRSTALPYPSAASTPYPTEYTGSQSARPAVIPGTISGSEMPPPAGFVLPPPGYDTVHTPARPRQTRGEGDSHIEELGTEPQDDSYMSHVYSPNTSRVHTNGKARRKKGVKSLSDSSIAAQCGHTREEDKIATRGRRKSSRELDHSRADIRTDIPVPEQTLDSTSDHTNKPTGQGREDISSNVSTSMVTSSFDSLAHNIVKDCHTIQQPNPVENVGSQDAKHGNLRAEESSDDSDLEIIEEEPDIIQSI